MNKSKLRADDKTPNKLCNLRRLAGEVEDQISDFANCFDFRSHGWGAALDGGYSPPKVLVSHNRFPCCVLLALEHK